MATETFDKTIWLDEKAAEILANELEKPRKPYVRTRDKAEEEGRAQEWLKRFVSKTLPDSEESANSYSVELCYGYGL